MVDVLRADGDSGWRAAVMRAGACGMLLLLFHLVVNRQYGFHGDELYFVECGLRPAWGYVDHPPFVPTVSRLATSLFGLNLFALRLFPAVSLALSCMLTGLLAWRLGAGRYGQSLAMTAFAFAPAMIRAGAFLNIPSFEVLFWLLLAHALVSLEITDRPTWWLLVGALAGLSLLNKHTTLFFGCGLAFAAVATHRRRDLATPWPWLGGVIALALFAPNLIWQCRQDWATLEFVRALNADVMQDISRPAFLIGQVVFLNPASVPVWIAGLWFLLGTRRGRPFAMLAWIYLVMLALLLILKSKEYYLAPAYPMLFAAGGALLERWSAGTVARLARHLIPVAIVLVGLVMLPIASPVGSLDEKARYTEWLLGSAVDTDAILFDFYNQVSRDTELGALAHFYEALPVERNRECPILAGDYALAAAINLRSPKLPRAISGSNSYYLWGPGDITGERLLVIRYRRDLLEECFANVAVAGHIPPRYTADPPDGVPIYYCAGPKAPLAELWPRFKRYR